MGIMGKLGGSVLQGLAGNLNEVSPDALQQEYGMYLMDGEHIVMGFQLLRDVVIFSDKRIIDIDKQGGTGGKMRIDSINLSSIFRVSAETAGFGVDDSEINIEYITSPYFRCSSGAETEVKTLEFPKRYNIQPLYKFLQEIAYNNYQSLNS